MGTAIPTRHECYCPAAPGAHNHEPRPSYNPTDDHDVNTDALNYYVRLVFGNDRKRHVTLNITSPGGHVYRFTLRQEQATELGLALIQEAARGQTIDSV